MQVKNKKCKAEILSKVIGTSKKFPHTYLRDENVVMPYKKCVKLQNIPQDNIKYTTEAKLSRRRKLQERQQDT